MTTHTVTRNANTARVDLVKCREDGLGKLFRDVAVHLVALVPWGLGGVDVEACTATEIVGVVLTLDLETT